MGRSTIPPALIELSNPSSPEAQLNALRNLKNEIVGHEQRKELAVIHGVVKPLAALLRTEARKGGKRRRGVANGSGGGLGERAAEWSTEDELRFQATLVVGSLANGGPAFITPLIAGDILPPLLEALSPNETPSKLILATLRTLLQIVDAVALEKPWWDSSMTLSHTVNERIYTKPVLDSLGQIIMQTPRSRMVYQQIQSTTQLITKTCHEDSQRKMLLDECVLDLLTVKMVAIAAGDDPSGRSDMIFEKAYALPVAYLSDMLEAISAIIKDSHYNTARFLYSQPIQNLFMWPKGRNSAYDTYSGSAQASAWEKLIPRLQTLQSKTDPYTKTWPALGSYTSTAAESYNRLPSMDSIQQQTPNRNVITDESETPLFTWLIHVARRGEGRERLSACWLLALLKKFGEKWSLNDPSRNTRDRHFSYLIIPLVVKMIEVANLATKDTKTNAAGPLDKEHGWFPLERSPLVLAELVANNKTLQNAVMDARILPVLVQILKRSFDPIANSTKPLWQPKPAAPAVRDPMIDSASSILGPTGVSADVLHAFKYRESALLALAAIGDSQDSLRKCIIEMGAATHIIDSLVPYQAGASDPSSSSQNLGSTSAKDGNPEAVLIAACKVTRSLSRSVSVLRTSLIDHGIAQPSFDLLTHPNVKVQIAATEVITNLVLEVSPMRTEIIEAGALKTLCEHCRSANFDLRYGSLWALKHLCLGLPFNMKIHCLEELGVGWLVQVLHGEPSRPASSAPLGMGTPNAAGEQVDILNAVDDPHMDVDEDPSSSEDEDAMTDSIPALRRHQRLSSRYTSATNVRDRLQQIRNDEQDSRLTSERDDVKIQEQALDFIRNFITGLPGDPTGAGEMIDHLLKSLGHSAFFELLDSKLRPKNSASPSSSQQQSSTSTNTSPTYWPNTAPQRLTPFSTPSHPQPSLSTQASNWSAYPPIELITATLYILVHLANGRPAHRSLLISQHALMSHVLPLLSHPRREVRLPCAWFLNNLVWVEDHADEAPTRERAAQLRLLGFEEGARLLGRDVDLDIRERAKTAIEQMGKLLGTNTGGNGGGSAGGSGYASPVAGGSGFGGDGSGLGGMRGLGRLHPGQPGAWGRGNE
ncbi:ARM repeat-containing protein [Lentithecium fluviatile CBS 122367]|uniref:ARM repeat-containing protein n=1 Tax=Lentithecium fluviatile CBS 122367 TaxID=1168545 RepID=A0A6G1JEC5_9PLEO|nr:ARM repeat-containing protein [Lentithecium fluviatile CBS 122367]